LALAHGSLLKPAVRALEKSVVVGAAATAADLGALTLLIEGVGFTPRAANVPALLVGVLVQFLGNKLFAFGDRSRAWLAQGLAFAAVELGALALNALLFHLVCDALPYLMARAATSAAVYLLYSYPLWGRIFAAPTGGK
jgi:putative flippase GtrA